jgi:hypothetical protein
MSTFDGGGGPYRHAELGQLPATATSDSAASGMVGYYSTADSTSFVALVSDTVKKIATITIPPGDFDVRGFVQFNGSTSTTVNYTIGSISTSAGLENTHGRFTAFTYPTQTLYLFLNGTNAHTYPVGPTRYSTTSNTTINLYAQSGFGTQWTSASGMIAAREVR